MQGIHHDCIPVAATPLRAMCSAVLQANQVPPADADYVAWHLVETNLRGTDSHGVARLPHYVRRLKGGSILPRPAMKFSQLAPATGTLDGGHGLGHLVMRRAEEEAARLAETAGAGWVAVSNSSHCGALAPYGLRLAERGMIGIAFSHVDPMVLPHGAKAPFGGTNPVCLTAPGEHGQALCLDMATSIVPWNVVANAAKEGVPIPSGWAVDREGRDTTDARAVHALYPFGTHKGSGLGIMADVLCALLSGAPFGPDIPKMYGDMTEHRRLGGLVGAISIRSFTSPETFAARASELMARLGALPPAAGTDRVRYPGEIETETKALREREGIPVGANIFAELNELAVAFGVEPLRAAHP